MQNEKTFSFSEFLIGFFVTSGCICLLMGVMGLLAFPEQRFGYEAFFMPLIFGVLTSLPRLLLLFKKKTNRLTPLFHLLNLLMVEGIVIGINALAGTLISFGTTSFLALGIAVVYGMVCLVLHLNDRRIASEFNKQLSLWQEKMQMSQDFSE